MLRILSFLFVLAIAISSCTHSHTHENTNLHEHESASLQLTSYTEEYEIFAECTPLSVGDTAFVLAHFTHLQDFKPLEDAQIALQLKMPSSEVSAYSFERVRSGIFRFALIPDQAGAGQIILIMNDDNAEPIRLAEVIVFDNAEKAAEDAAAKEISSDNRITFTKEQSWKIPFSTSIPQMMNFGPVVHTSGIVQESLDGSFYITSPMEGVVQFTQNMLIPGKELRKGEKLMQIQSAGLIGNDLQIQAKEAESRYRLAKDQYERAEKLSKDKIVAEKELIELKNQFEMAKIQNDRFQNQLSAGAKSIHSKETGILAECYVSNGEFVSPGQKLAKVISKDSYLIKAEIPLRYAALIPELEDAMIMLPSSREAASILALGGAILPQNAVISTNNQLIPLYLQLPATDPLLAGMFIETALKFKGADSTLVVPKSALIENLGVFYVFVQITPELFEKRKILTGANDGLNFVVTEGLQKNERIVTDGAVLVKLAEASGALDAHAGHHH